MVRDYLGIKIDTRKDALIPEQGMSLLMGKGFYRRDYETSPQESYARAATSYCFGDYDFAQRIYDYVSNQWFMFASPVLSNAVEVEWPTDMTFDEGAAWLKNNVKPHGLPISCFVSHIHDSREGLVEARTETAWLSMLGGGIGLSMNNRAPDEKSTGVMAHLRGYDADTLSMRQSATRRGSMAAYLDIDHPEIMNFIQMRNPVGGDQNKKCFNLNHGVNITDSFLRKVIDGEDIELVDPKHGPTGTKINSRDLWEEILRTRYETGEPYLNFIDTINKNRPKHITNPLYHVTSSNLCNEIQLYTDMHRTAVCCLSSLNLEKFDEWKDTNIIEDLIRLLDNVLEYFIQLAPKELKRAVYSASQERSLGLGAMGFHAYLQKNDIAFESGGFNSAAQLNNKLFSHIKEKALEASKKLGDERGEASDCEGTGFRNAHLMAVAPNASSSSLVGTSPSIEPWNSNAFNSQGRSGSFLIKNKYLEKVLDKYGKNDEVTWKSITLNEGSVQHLDFLSEHEKNVFKTAAEINQLWVVEHAADRQKYICQSQSLNIFVDNNVTLQELSDLHMRGWMKGVKGFYYLRSKPATRASLDTGESVSNTHYVKSKVEFHECLSCEG